MLRALVVIVLAVRLLVVVMRGDIFDDVAGFLNTVTSIPGDAVRAVWRAISGIGSFFSHLNELVDAAWDWMVNGIEWLGSRVVWGLGAAFTVLEWLTVRWIPMAAHWALGEAAALAYGLAKQVEHLAVTLVDKAVNLVRGLIGDLASWARASFRLVTGVIGQLLKWTEAAGRLVFGILAHPEVLVSWILPALLVPLIKFVVRSSAPVIRWLIGQFVHLAPELAGTLEEAIAKLL